MPPETGGVLFVHAHPDDECVGTGGSIARLVAEGVRVDLVTCTDGAEGEVHDPTLDPEEARPRLTAIRAAELACSLDALGGGAIHHHLLGYRDSGMIGTDANAHPDAFWQADLEVATDRLIEIIREARPAAIVTYDENGNYGHPDHINAARIARQAYTALAGGPDAVDRFYELAWARERWAELFAEMTERGIPSPWARGEEEAAVAGEASEAEGLRGRRVRPPRCRSHDPRRRLGLRRAEAPQHGVPSDAAPGHGLDPRASAGPRSDGARHGDVCAPLAPRRRRAVDASRGVAARKRAAYHHELMATRALNLTDDLVAYVRRYGVREHPALVRLRERTAPMPMSQMQIGSEQGAFMALLVKLIGAKRIVEIGTFTGYSSTSMALALPPDGRITCLDVSREWTDVAREAWAEAGVADKVDLRLAPAAETLATLDDDSFDMAFIDADKPGYDTYYEECLRVVRSGGLILIDNVLWSGEVAEPGDGSENARIMRALNEKVAADERVDYVLLPIGDGLTLARVR